MVAGNWPVLCELRERQHISQTLISDAQHSWHACGDGILVLRLVLNLN